VKIAVTGGAGFIGGHVVDELIRRGHDPVVFDHQARSHKRWSPELQRSQNAHGFMLHDTDLLVPVMLGDTRDDVAVTELAAHVEGIIHLASVLGTQETVYNPRPAVMTNVISGMNVMEAATQYNIPVVNICVGNAGMSNPYSASKTCVETLGHMYARDRGTKINQVRAVNAYGPRQLMARPYGPGRVRKIIPAFVARALTGAPIEIYGDGEQVSDCVYVEDVARALVQTLEWTAENHAALPHVVEVGPSEHHTVNEVAHLVRGMALATGVEQPELRHLPMRPGETPGARIIAKNSTLHSIGMNPADLLPLADGLSRTVAWYADSWLPGHRAWLAANQSDVRV
jgi:UDP-glucose 4-epimerase